jgi:O-antigen/teichoic acid export membrane protein
MVNVPEASKSTFSGLVDNVENVIVGIVIPILFSLALMYFLIGVSRYIKKAEDQAERTKARQMILWGLIFITAMVSVWTLVSIVSGTIGQKNVELPKTPTDIKVNIPQDWTNLVR